jgi:peptide/nickel transport system permease protein
VRLVRPPETVVYERYREAERAGQVQWILRAPVPYSPTDYLRDTPDVRRTPPSRAHWLGVEEYGADVLSRMIHAARIALSIGFIATGISVVVGVIIGGLMGYFAGKVDMFGMRLIEIFEVVPQLVLLIICVAVFGRNLYLMMAIIGLTSWTTEARFIRAEFLRLRKQDFVQAAIAAGLPLRSIVFRHMLPNGIAPVLVAASFGVASAILYESTLSFLGLGLVQEPSWGQMLNQARSAGASFSWWIAVFPGMAIFLTVFAYNLIGEALRDALDPKLRQAH